MAKVAFLGLGIMGYPMAGHLVSAGHSVTVYNRSGAKAASWSEHHKGGHQPTPREAAAGQAVVFACVGNDDDLRSVCLGDDGAFAGMDEGALFVDHTTVSPTVTRELAQAAAAQGLRYVDAPISGGQAGAENGILTVMCGGAQADFDEAFPVIDAYARKCMLIGPVGAGQQTKMLNQICIAGLVQGLSEAVALGQALELDMEAVLDVISGVLRRAGRWRTAARPWLPMMEFGFAVDWMRKDLGICLDEARANGMTLPVTALVDQFYGDVQKMGGGRWDTSSLLRRLTKTPEA